MDERHQIRDYLPQNRSRKKVVNHDRCLERMFLRIQLLFEWICGRYTSVNKSQQALLRALIEFEDVNKQIFM